MGVGYYSASTSYSTTDECPILKMHDMCTVFRSNSINQIFNGNIYGY